MTGMTIFQLSYLHIEPVYKKPLNLHPLNSCTVGKYQSYIIFYITLILYIHCRKPKLPIDMEYTEDIIGNSAVSEDDNTNQSQNDYGDDCVDGDCDRRVMVMTIVMVIQKEVKGVMVQMATVVMPRLLIIMLGLQLMIKLMMAMMTV